MKRILAIVVLSVSLAGCVYGGGGSSYGGYSRGGTYGGSGAGTSVPSGEVGVSPG